MMMLYGQDWAEQAWRKYSDANPNKSAREAFLAGLLIGTHRTGLRLIEAVNTEARRMLEVVLTDASKQTHQKGEHGQKEAAVGARPRKRRVERS